MTQEKAPKNKHLFTFSKLQVGLIVGFNLLVSVLFIAGIIDFYFSKQKDFDYLSSIPSTVTVEQLKMVYGDIDVIVDSLNKEVELFRDKKKPVKAKLIQLKDGYKLMVWSNNKEQAEFFKNGYHSTDLSLSTDMFFLQYKLSITLINSQKVKFDLSMRENMVRNKLRGL